LPVLPPETFDATLAWSTPTHIAAITTTGLIFWYEHQGRGGCNSWREGDVLVIHVAQDFKREIFAVERPKDFPAASDPVA